MHCLLAKFIQNVKDYRLWTIVFKQCILKNISYEKGHGFFFHDLSSSRLAILMVINLLHLSIHI